MTAYLEIWFRPTLEIKVTIASDRHCAPQFVDEVFENNTWLRACYASGPSTGRTVCRPAQDRPFRLPRTPSSALS
jgi:hypothetical protein